MRRKSYKNIFSNGKICLTTRENSEKKYVKNHTFIITYNGEVQLVKDIENKGLPCECCGSKSCNERKFKQKRKGENKQKKFDRYFFGY